VTIEAGECRLGRRFSAVVTKWQSSRACFRDVDTHFEQCRIFHLGYFASAKAEAIIISGESWFARISLLGASFKLSPQKEDV
jgi:hypothetical protein